MIESERRNDMEAADANQVLDEERLVIRGAILKERDGGGGGAARRVEKIRAGVRVVQGVASEWRLAVIGHASESERAAPEHGAFAPFLPESQIDSSVVELFISKRGARWKNGGIERRR